SGGGRSRVFQVDEGVTATLAGLTIKGGGGTADRGGGLLNFGTLTLANCTVSGNTASQSGGGLANYGTANLTNCTAGGNTASQSGGGLANYRTANLTNCTVNGNTAGGSGAGLFSSGGTLTVHNSAISGSTTGIQVVARATATITGGAISTG